MTKYRSVAPADALARCSITGGLVRPGIAFVALFVVLLTVYLLLADTLGGPVTFGLQAGIVLMVIGAARWLRRTRSHSGWHLFSDEGSTPSQEPDATGTEAREDDPQVPKAR